MKLFLCILLILFIHTSCKKQTIVSNQDRGSITNISSITQESYPKYDSLFRKHSKYIAESFDFPVGKPDGKGYYNAQKFGENLHLGDDWNGIGGGNSDLGDPIYSIANGYIFSAEDIGSGWGNVIRIIHQFKGKYYESIYAHCNTIKVKKGDLIKKGTIIATIGNAGGIYLAHLHLEIRDRIFMEIGGGYSEDISGYLDPTKFINKN